MECCRLNNTIRNCRTGVKFDPYTAFSTNGLAALNNRSTFSHARFEWTEDFDNIHGDNNPLAHANLNGVRASFRACAFEHSGQYPQYSSQLGYGIRAHNSTVWVMAACPNGTSNCPTASLQPSTFTGLDHGIHATSSVGVPRLTITRSEFSSNVCGVYAENLRHVSIRNNSFVLGDREVELDNFPLEQYWNGNHRGIFLTRCNALRVMDNELAGASETVAGTEGVVIGFTRKENETVRGNTIRDIGRAYVGEGECAHAITPYAIGLQYLCNTNQGNFWNIWSRIAEGSSQSTWPTQTIRLNQGAQNVPALNFLDNGTNSALDLRVSTPSAITYWHVAAPNYQPTTWQGDVFPTLSGPTVYYGCPIIISNVVDAMALQGEVEQARQAYAGLRFLYANLIDGGSTDVLLDEIADAWPQDYWDLRAYLLSKSPYLSVEALMAAMDKAGFPDAMRAEICIANPEATRSSGFMRWLEYECIAPLPEHLLDNIVASWDTRTYRATLEMQMGQEHLRMSEAAYTLADLLAADDEELGTDMEEELQALQALRTVGARYAEAMALMAQHQFEQARSVMNALPAEHDLRGPDAQERARMLTYINFHEALHTDGRNEAQLTPAEIAQLEAFIAVEHDQPTQWASNLLCYNYGICRSPYTGDAGTEPKARNRRPVAAPKQQARLGIKPNPANAWVVFTYELPALQGQAQLVIVDALGRAVHTETIGQAQGQVLVDTRRLPAGAYLAELLQEGQRLLRAERLIIQP